MQITHELPKGLLAWYPFQKNTDVLYIGQAEDPVAELLQHRELNVQNAGWNADEKKADLSGFRESDRTFDYIIIPYIVERTKMPSELLSQCHSLLREDGVLLYGMNNRLSLRNFCGDRDPYTDRNLDGIENYVQLLPAERDALAGREYSKAQMEAMLAEAGWEYSRFYSVLPNLEAPQLIYGPEAIPKEDLANRVFPRYHYPDTVFLNEERLYEDMIRNGMFHPMANAYLVESTKKRERQTEVQSVTLSLERSEEDAMATVLYQDKVEKHALYPQGQKKFERMMEQEADLRAHGIATVDSRMVNSVYTMPYVDAANAVQYMQELFFKDKELFLKTLDEYRDLVLQSSEHVQTEDDSLGVILKRGYIDLVMLNSFYMDGRFVFYDQEFCQENLPANVLLFRSIVLIYSKGLEMTAVMPIEELWKRYGMQDKIDVYSRYSNEFTSKLRNLSEQQIYLQQHQKNGEMVNSNRQRMNFSAQEYQRLFVDIFDGLENRKLILFGSGNFTKKFLALYAKDYPVHAIIDNNPSKWGTVMEGVTILSPDLLTELEEGTYKVLICIKKYLDVLKQLQQMGVKQIGIYDTNMNYPRKEQRQIVVHKDSQQIPKKYRRGYIAGVFDLFHVGHLNMFKRAKEQCDHLIVGVVTDEGVRKNKKTEPFIPFEERIEMVRSCKYVDEAVEIPLVFADTQDAHRMYRFDCQFSGSDYQDDPGWLAKKEYLAKQGADLVFFPYTESTSSTKIKGLIEKSLL